MEELQAKQDDLSRRVEREEGKGLKRLSQIQVWLTKVDTIKTQVNAIFSMIPVESQRLSLCGFCSTNLKSRYRHGKRVFLMLKEVENLNSIRDFQVVAEQAQSSEVEERPIQPGIVGRETMLKKAWDYLTEDGVCIMGLYGMGGVGKTTLLTQINNKFRHDGYVGFGIVIWIVVSKDSHTQKIQEEIANKLGMVGDDWNKKDKNQKACDIHNVLKRKTFVLLLDDIWEKVNLSEIGIPFPNTENGCKVIFTTRSQEVCRRMGVDVEMEVQCLAPNDALDLFLKKLERSHYKVIQTYPILQT